MRNLVSIKLGNRCNLSCEYCCQKDMYKKDMYKKNMYVYKPEILIPKVVDTIKNKFNNDSYIYFVGGETLLYMDIIKDVVERMKEFSWWNSKYILYTNGYYLTDELVDYFNENNFEIYVSWDGTASKITRGYNIFDDKDKLNVMKRIENLYITTLITNESLLLDKFDILNSFNKEYLKYNFYSLNVIFRIIRGYYYKPEVIKRFKEEINTIIDTRYTSILESKFLNGECKPSHRNILSYIIDGKKICAPSQEDFDRYQAYIFCKKCPVTNYCISHTFSENKAIYCYLCRILYTI